MTRTFSTAVTELLRYADNLGDTTMMGDALVMALRSARARNSEWGGGRVDFYLEDGVSEYFFGNYPRLPGGIMAITSTPLCSMSAVSGAILSPDTLVSSTNMTGDIDSLRDSAEDPTGNDDLRPTTVAATDFVVRWDVALSRPLVPGLVISDTVQGRSQGPQVMRVSMFNQGTTRPVTWEVLEGVTSIATGTFSVNSPNRKVYEARWNAGLLSTFNPAANQITLKLADAAGEVACSAVQWFTRARDEATALTAGQWSLEYVNRSETMENLGNRHQVIRGRPRRVSVFNEGLEFYPAPDSPLFVTFAYQKDSSRDAATNDLITNSSTTETNEWFDRGWTELMGEALATYQSLRPKDVKAAQLAGLVGAKARQANDVAQGRHIFDRPPRGHL